jgi:hypothetical protein
MSNRYENLGRTDKLTRSPSVRAFHTAGARRPHLSRIVDYEAGRDSARLAHPYTGPTTPTTMT